MGFAISGKDAEGSCANSTSLRQRLLPRETDHQAEIPTPQRSREPIQPPGRIKQRLRLPLNSPWTKTPQPVQPEQPLCENVTSTEHGQRFMPSRPQCARDELGAARHLVKTIAFVWSRQVQ